MRPYDVHYYYQHKFLPGAFYQQRKTLINALAEGKGRVLFLIARDLFAKAGYAEVPFTADDFNATVIECNDKTSVCKVTFPNPEEPALCYCAFMFYDSDFSKLSYFTVEKGEDLSILFGKAFGSDESYFLCGWDEKHAHLNFGTYKSIDQAYEKALEIYG